MDHRAERVRGKNVHEGLTTAATEKEVYTAFSPAAATARLWPASTGGRGAQPSVARQGAAWTGGAGWVTVERQGFTGSEGLAAVRRESLGGQVYVYGSPTQVHILTRTDELHGEPVLPQFRLPLTALFGEVQEAE
jgi:hypothetical protein